MNLKFRIWSDYHKKFVVEGGEFGLQRLFEDFSATVRGKWNRDEDYSMPSHIGDYKITQFTGLTDKNGQDIYEGDILKWRIGGNFSEVVFSNGSFFVKGINWGAFWYLGDYNDSYEIVGNIFQTHLDNQAKDA